VAPLLPAAAPEAQWAKASACELCGKKFGMLRRRHHCRVCAKSVCDGCSPRRVLLRGGGGVQRACGACAGVCDAAELARGLRAGWTDRGGPGADISPDGRTTSKSTDIGWSTAGGERLPMCGAVSLTTAGERGFLSVGLAAAEKDVSRGGFIEDNPDTWMIRCGTSNMYVGDKSIDGTGEIKSQQIITIEWDQQGVSFLVDGVRRGEKHAWGSTPPTGVRVVTCMGYKSSASFVV
jgi:hypothetical protein